MVDLLDWQPLIEYPSRLFLAAFLGVAISFQRSPDRYQLNLMEAHALLAAAGAIFMLIIAGELIRAVGLLAAASVVRFRYSIRNPRDAATLILALGLGMACGSGRMEIAIVGAVFLIIVSKLLASFPDMLPFSMVKRREEIILRIQTEDIDTTMKEIHQLFAELDIHYTLLSFEKKVNERRGETTEVDLQINYNASLNLEELTAALMSERIHRLSWREIPVLRF